MKYLITYLVIINIIALLAYQSDKRKSIKGKWRIKETTLLSFSLIGGGVGSLIGMYKFHHKTKKLTFKIGVPILTIISFIIIWFITREYLL
jgi:uncharacterized membrane protein YsdA (DUF1294 family)